MRAAARRRPGVRLRLWLLLLLLLLLCGGVALAQTEVLQEEEKEEERAPALLLQPALSVVAAAGEGRAGVQGQGQGGAKHAYVTLLYNDFILGVRVLGASLRATGTKADMVVLCVGGHLPSHARDTLREDGWRVHTVEGVRNPNANYADRLLFAYAKLAIYTLTQYETVVFLDADTLVLSNVDELFGCAPFCAVMRHSELLNSGVLVVQPSEHMSAELQSRVDGAYSYTGGDQGFLNTYYDHFAACPLFDPNVRVPAELMPSAASSNEPLAGDASCWRLPQRYNGDWPMIILDGNLECVHATNPMPEDFSMRRKTQILHYTLGAAKPWHWYVSPYLPHTGLWQSVRAELPESASDITIRMKAWLVLLLPVVIATLLLRFWTLLRPGRLAAALPAAIRGVCTGFLAVLGRACGAGGMRLRAVIHAPYTPRALIVNGVLVAAMTVASISVALWAVPDLCDPLLAWTVFLEWFFCAMALLGTAWLRAWKAAGSIAHHHGNLAADMDDEEDAPPKPSVPVSGIPSAGGGSAASGSGAQLEQSGSSAAATARMLAAWFTHPALRETAIVFAFFCMSCVCAVVIPATCPAEALDCVLVSGILAASAAFALLAYAVARLPLLWHHQAL